MSSTEATPARGTTRWIPAPPGVPPRRPGDRKTGAELRKFGWVMATALAALTALAWWHGAGWWAWAAGIGALFLAVGTVLPRALGPVERLWMRIAGALAVVMTTLVLTLTYYLVITPIGLLMRLLGMDQLGLRLDRDADSYWVSAEPDGPGTRPRHPF